MVALFGLPGSSLFAWNVVPTRKAGNEWLDEHLAKLGESQQTLNDRRQSRVVSNEEASKLRWRDGSHVCVIEGVGGDKLPNGRPCSY